MKRFFLLCALAAGLALGAQAQSFSWGVVAGMNLTKLKPTEDVGLFSSKNRVGWFIGPKIVLTSGFGLGLDAALEYSQRTLEASYTEEGMPSAAKTDAHYCSVELPINLRYSIGFGKMCSVYIATGPQFSFGLNDVKWKQSEHSAHSEAKGVNTMWNVGCGLRIAKHFDMGLGYNFTLGNVGHAITDWANIPGTSNVPSWKCNTFQVQVAYMF